LAAAPVNAVHLCGLAPSAPAASHPWMRPRPSLTPSGRRRGCGTGGQLVVGRRFHPGRAGALAFAAPRPRLVVSNSCDMSSDAADARAAPHALRACADPRSADHMGSRHLYPRGQPSDWLKFSRIIMRKQRFLAPPSATLSEGEIACLHWLCHNEMQTVKSFMRSLD
jgi:hypothetical protein